MNKHFKDWAVEQHSKTNHLYDNKLPYAFHLGLVVDIATKYKHIWKILDLFPNINFYYQIMYNACWGHDLIEDTRVTYNDILAKLKSFGYNYDTAKKTTEIIYALTNEKGRNRQERANKAYYEGIVNTPGAIFVKLCDRIANVKYSELTKSSMLEKYKKEYPSFVISLGLGYYDEANELTFTERGLIYDSMINELEAMLGIPTLEVE